MVRKLVPFVAALALLGFFLGPGRSFLPTPPEARPSAAPDAAAAAAHDHGATSTGSGIGLAPSPVVNPAPTAARVNVTVTPAERVERGYVIQVAVRGPDLKPLPDATVKFYELVDLFGTREMILGSGVTDGSGVVTITYLPAQFGTHDLVVRTSPIAKVSAGEGRATFAANVAAPEATVQRPALATFSDKIPYAAGLVVVAVWSLIAFALFATARGVISGARGTQEKGEPA